MCVRRRIHLRKKKARLSLTLQGTYKGLDNKERTLLFSCPRVQTKIYFVCQLAVSVVLATYTSLFLFMTFLKT